MSLISYYLFSYNHDRRIIFLLRFFVTRLYVKKVKGIARFCLVIKIYFLYLTFL